MRRGPVPRIAIAAATLVVGGPAFGQQATSFPWSTVVVPEVPASWQDPLRSPEGEPIGHFAQAAPATVRETPRGSGASPAVVSDTGAPRRAAAGPASDGPSAEELVRRYCKVAAPTAERARLEKDRREVEAAALELDKRIEALKEATTQHKEWLAKRTAFQAQAQEALVRMYARMKPEAAAAQIGEMDIVAAAAVLSRMESKSAGAILAEIEPVRAGRISSIIAGAADLGSPQTAVQDKKVAE